MSSSNKRERDLARAKFERQQQRRVEAEAARKRRTRNTWLIAGLAVVAVAVVALFFSLRSSSDQTAASATSTPSATGSASASASASASTSAQVVKGCASTPPSPEPQSASFSAPAAQQPAAGKAFRLTLDTNCGPVRIRMDSAAAPKTTSAIAFLAQQGFYTYSDCFRLTTKGIFVFQCGSPTNNGMGGPGFQIPDENLPTSKGQNGYPAGTVAMANSGANTNGSQFFIVYKDGSKLGPNYTIWGTVESGLDMLNRVAAAGVQGGGADGKPVQPLVITKATVTEVPATG